MKLFAICGVFIFVAGIALAQDGDALVTDDKAAETEENVVTEEVVADPTTTPASAPTTPTAAPPATTTAITPVDPKTDDKPAKGKYYLNKNNKTCIMLEMSARLQFSYMKKSGNETEKAKVMWDIPPENATTVGGECSPSNSSKMQMLTLTFFENWVMTFTFNKTKDEYYISNISLDYVMDGTRFPNTSESSNETMRSSKTFKELYEVDSGKSFRCDSEEKVESFEGGNLTSFTTWDLQVQAFRGDNKTKFDDAVYCDADTKVSNLVPIIVGAALAGLVLIVLVAYLIGRHRNRQGYQSV